MVADLLCGLKASHMFLNTLSNNLGLRVSTVACPSERAAAALIEQELSASLDVLICQTVTMTPHDLRLRGR